MAIVLTLKQIQNLKELYASLQENPKPNFGEFIEWLTSHADEYALLKKAFAQRAQVLEMMASRPMSDESMLILRKQSEALLIAVSERHMTQEQWLTPRGKLPPEVQLASYIPSKVDA